MTIRKFLMASAASAILIAPYTSYASNGAYMIGYGAKSRGMGGVGVAYSQDALAIAYNPANLSQVKRTRLDIGADIFVPPRAVKHDSAQLPADERATTDLFLVPNLGFAYVLDEKWSWGFAMVGAGLQSEFDQTVPNSKAPGSNSYFFNFNNLATNEVGVELMQIQMLPSIAYKVNKTHTLGASLAIGVQLFRAEGLQAFVDLGFAKPGNEDSITNNDFDWSYGAGFVLGWKGHFLDDKLQFGLNYASKVNMSEFDKYSGLFPDAGDFDIPPNYSFGVVYEFLPKAHVAFDIKYVDYEDVKAFRNEGPLANDPAQFYPLCPDPNDTDECKLGGSKGMGFGWKNHTVYKLGADYTINEKWIIRGGLNYAEQPIPPDQALFNLLSPGVTEWHYTIGTTYNWNEDVELSFNFMYAPKVVLEGVTAFGPTQAPVQGTNAALSMYQYSLGGSLGWKF